VESLRADAQLTSLQAYASTHACIRSARHFSSSHATELGVFSLLYGLDASRFPAFARAGTPSAILQILRDNGYAIYGGSASALQNWNHAGFIAAQLDGYREFTTGEPWRGDRALVDWALSLPRKAPWLLFAFLDSTHLDYSYPPEMELDRPAERPDFSRAIGRARLRDHEVGIKNRYRNAVRWVDRQLARLLPIADAVIFTGDHGEELWDEGLLGHSAPRFINARIQVPLLFCFGVDKTVPRSAHADLLPTLLDWAGVRAPADGESRLADHRGDVVVTGAGFPADCGDLCLIDEQRKMWLRADASWPDRYHLTRLDDLNDHPITDARNLDAHIAAFTTRLHHFLR
jgi:membrane-anchored protein YejM (alkaline phosphatase superfamily)